MSAMTVELLRDVAGVDRNLYVEAVVFSRRTRHPCSA